MPQSDSREHVYARVLVSGRVQGVGYRAFTQRVGTARRLAGGVRNLDTGQVELEVEGSRAVIEDLLAELRKGPVGSRVTQVQVEWSTAADRFTDFQIWY
ncbi:MAG: acylphosphatase [Nitrospiraceae bacterium]|nr:acylphosphatase [Nitrospiraceae bacterium]